MWFTYIIYSSKIDKYYTGYTQDLELRLKRHNDGWGKYSSIGIPWKLVYHESFHNKTDAIKKESFIKKKKSRKFFENLIAGGRPDPE